MKNRILSLFLALLVAIPLFAVTAQAATATEQEMLDVLALLNVMNGDENGDLQLDRTVTRAEFTKMVIAASIYKDLGSSTAGIAPFSDVPASHWAAGYITTARNAGWLNGYLDGTFRPNRNVTMAEAVTVVLKVLGYTDSDFTGTWPSGQMSMCRTLKLDRNISASQNQALTRRECGWLVYNMLSASTKSGTAQAVTLGYALDAAGNPDYLSLVNSKIEGPLVITSSDWVNAIGFIPERVYRNDTLTTLDAIANYDVVYYVEEIDTVWAYSTKKTGTLDAISPNRTSPSSVTVAGVTYTLGTSQAAASVSSVGSFQVGDTVTLLIGRDDTVAAVLDTAKVSGTIYGMVTTTGQASYQSASGSTYTADYVDILATDGQTYRYQTTASFDEGNLVCAELTSGGVTISLLSKTGTYAGTVTSDGFSGSQFADHVEILDICEDTGVTVSVSRLSGVSLSNSDVRFAARNSAGEITHLILNDVTGDAYRFGILTDVSSQPTGTLTFVDTYTVILGGQETDIPCQNRKFNTSKGPVRILMDDSGIQKIFNLEQVRLDAVSGNVATTASGQSFPIASGVQVYQHRNGEYYLTALDLVSDPESYTLTGWYDHTQDAGGQIRVIVATAR